MRLVIPKLTVKVSLNIVWPDDAQSDGEASLRETVEDKISIAMSELRLPIQQLIDAKMEELSSGGANG